MKMKVLACACVAALFMMIGAAGTGEIASRDRIIAPVDSTQVSAVRGTAHPLARSNFDQGRTDPTHQITATITFRLSTAQQADMNLLLQQQQDRTSPNYHKWLTPEQYAARFGMTKNDLAKVSAWLQSQGLRVESISRNRNEITFSGSVGQVKYALNTELHNYVVNGERHFANATNVSFPAAFSSQILGVRGLNDFSPKPRVHPTPKFTSNLTGNHFVIPGDFATIYNLKPLYSQGLDGAGQSIAVVGQTTIALSDIDAFRSASGLPKFDPALVQVPNTGSALSCSGDLGEADLDVEWSGAVAKSASVVYVFAGVGTGGTCNNRPKNVFDALLYAISNNVAPVVSISYGNCEANLPGGFPLTMQQWVQEANVQGQTVVGPSGDSGAADCELPTATTATQGLAVDVPAAIPEVTGVGGSEFSGDAGACPPNNTCPAGGAPATQYWGAATTLNSGPTALQYIPEITWNDTALTGSLDGGGGGASTVFAKPSWQSGTGVPADGARDVPDVALNASNAHDPYLVCSQGSCVNGFRDANNNFNAAGGTSFGAPTFAGIVAIINGATQSNGQGNINPTLYSLAGTSSFHDITSGNNKVPCTTGTPNCPSGTTSIGFNAGTGYDLVTGLGSPEVFNLVTAWPGFSSSQAYTIAASPSSVTISPGQPASATILAGGLNGFSGTVSLSCQVSTTSAGVGCSLSSPSVNLDSANTSQTVTVSLTTVAAVAATRSHRLEIWSATFVLPGILLFGIPRRNAKYCLLIMAAMLLMFLSACGGGSSNSQQQQQSQGTPAGTYIITVTGTSGAVSHNATVNLTVQ